MHTERANNGDEFERLRAYIQDYIYASKWTELRDIQVSACRVILTATITCCYPQGPLPENEAAFLPVLTELYNKPSASVGVLYITH
jgi:ATP-dependent Lhr-like helicase